MPTPVLRVALALSALLVALLLAGAGMGTAVADPGETGTGETPTVSEPEPTSAAPAPALPKTLAGALHDLLHRPLSIFGNGRIPGQPPKPVVTNPDGVKPTTERGRDKPATKPNLPDPEPAPVGPDPVEPVQKTSSTVTVVLPFSAPFSVPVPSIPVPGYEGLRWSIDLSDPSTALASMQETASTFNSLLSDAYAPYNPFQPPTPEPEPTFKILEEEPVVDAGGGAVTPVSETSSDLPVLQAPAIVPPVRVAVARPTAGTVPGGAGAQVLGAGTAGVRGPVLRGSVTQTGSTVEAQAPPNGSASAMGKPALRQGYPQYLRSARVTQAATIAVPGLVGLLAITASGSLIGYRQANSQRFLRTEAARFLQ